MSLRAKTDRKSHDFWQRVMYGMATANFLAVIQLISAPQFKTGWYEPLGMILMIANLPLSFGWAINNDIKALAKDYDFKVLQIIPAILSGVGIAGLMLTLKSFNPLFPDVFCGATLLAYLCISIDMWRRKLKRKRRSN